MSIEQTEVSTINDWIEKDQAILIDVREGHEFEMGHIPGAIHIPLSAFDISALPDPNGKHMVF